jgi:hypothetical protein
VFFRETYHVNLLKRLIFLELNIIIPSFKEKPLFQNATSFLFNQLNSQTTLCARQE